MAASGNIRRAKTTSNERNMVGLQWANTSIIRSQHRARRELRGLLGTHQKKWGTRYGGGTRIPPLVSCPYGEGKLLVSIQSRDSHPARHTIKHGECQRIKLVTLPGQELIVTCDRQISCNTGIIEDF